MQKYIIAVDAMGGDNAPGAIVEGCLTALKEMNDIRITLCGPEETIRPLLSGAGDLMNRINIINAPAMASA